MKRNLVTIALAASLCSGCSHSGPEAHTTPATENIKGQHFATAQLIDAGNTTSEVALESFYWALFRGHYDALIASYVPQARKDRADTATKIALLVKLGSAWEMPGENNAKNTTRIGTEGANLNSSHEHAA